MILTRRSALTGIGVASIVRITLFLAALGIVAQTDILASANPPAAVFEAAAGGGGRRIFGIVMWAAAPSISAGRPIIASTRPCASPAAATRRAG